MWAAVSCTYYSDIPLYLMGCASCDLTLLYNDVQCKKKRPTEFNVTCSLVSVPGFITLNRQHN